MTWRSLLKNEWTVLPGLVILGLVVRVVVWYVKGGFYYPDEVFQYLEPANLRLTGFAWLPWEFERGVRNWILPTFYGAWLWWGHLLGLDGFTIHRLICLHNALWSALLIPAAYRLGLALGNLSAARMSGLLVACYIPIVFFMPHTLNEVPGVLLTTWGLVWYAENRGQDRFWGGPLLAGLALGAAFVVRPTAGLWTVVPAFHWLIGRRWRSLSVYTAAGLAVVALSGLVDLVTWGRFLHSTLEYIDYNLVESGASHHGVSPWHTYLGVWFWQRLGVGGVLLVVLAALAGRHTWPLLLAAVLPVVASSAIAHKEERFLLSSYPLLLCAGAVGWAILASRLNRWKLAVTAAVLAVVVLATGLVGTLSNYWRWRAGVFAGQAFVGRQQDSTGVLLDDRVHLNGGYLLLNRHIPQNQFRRNLARHELFNYLVLHTGSPDFIWAGRNGFASRAVFDEMTVLQRERPPSAR